MLKQAKIILNYDRRNCGKQAPIVKSRDEIDLESFLIFSFHPSTKK